MIYPNNRILRINIGSRCVCKIVNVTSAESYLSATNRLCTNCAPESRLMPHLESRCPTIYRHTSQGRKDRDAVRLARDAERLNELQSTTAT